MTKPLKKILIMAGGTGGHVFPGLACAKAMLDQGIEVHWLGTEKGLEARLIPEAHIPLHVISIGGLRGKNFKTLLLAPFRLAVAIYQAMNVIRKVQPDVILGLGGFVSGPGGIASMLLRKPLVIHEQNAKAGMTNRFLAKIAKKVLQAFPGTFSASVRAETIGNPVRADIEALPPPEKRHHPFRLLILGGSLGAAALNELVPNALKTMDRMQRPIVVHQTGEKHIEATRLLYQSLGVEADVVPFIQDMANAYRSSDLVICRAGALTVAELCVAGVGAVLVPFPFAVDDHQTLNGNFMVKHQAAILVQQKALTSDKLSHLLSDLMAHPETVFNMAVSAYQLRQVDVVSRMIASCQEVLSR